MSFISPLMHGGLLTCRSTTLAGMTTSIETFVYETSTSLCPVTEVSTISGQEVTVVYTSTSLIVVQVPTTIVEYTTILTTCYETTEVYTTESVCCLRRLADSRSFELFERLKFLACVILSFC